MSISDSPERTSLRINSALRDARMRASPDRPSTARSHDGSYLINEYERITDLGMFIMRSFDSLCKAEGNSVDGTIDVKDVLDRIAKEEEAIFSPVPDYLEREWRKLAAENERSRREAASKVDSLTRINLEVRESVEGNSKTRIVIDPSIPLHMPFNHKRYLESQEGNTTFGCYHGLFYADGDPVEFKPPENNKRKEIEALRKAQTELKKSFERTPKKENVEPKKSLKVPSNFVPSCAAVDHSSAQVELRKRHEAEKEEKAKKRITSKTKRALPA